MCRLRMLEFNPQQAENILKGDAGVGYAISIAAWEFEFSYFPCISGGRSLAVEWMKAGAISELASLAQSEALKSGVYVPSDPRQAMHSIFDEPSYGRYARTAKFENSTLALIRPHALGMWRMSKHQDEYLQTAFGRSHWSDCQRDIESWV